MCKLILLSLILITLTGCATTIHSRSTRFPNGAVVTETNIYIAGQFVPPISSQVSPMPRVKRFEASY